MTYLDEFTLWACDKDKTLDKIETIIKKDNARKEEDDDAFWNDAVKFSVHDEDKHSPRRVQITVKASRFIMIRTSDDKVPDLSEEERLRIAEEIVEEVQVRWEKLSTGLPFDRFYLAEMSIISRIWFDEVKLIDEYIRLLAISMNLPDDGYLIKDSISEAENSDKLHRQFMLTPSESISFQRAFYDMNQPLYGDVCGNSNGISKEDISPVLNVTYRIMNPKKIDSIWYLYARKDESVATKISIFMACAEMLFLDKASSLFTSCMYETRNSVYGLIEDSTNNLDKEERDFLHGFMESYQYSSSDSDICCFKENPQHKDDWLRFTEILFEYDLQPALISDDIEETTSGFPEFCELVENGTFTL